jgi:hypothetical protein
VERLDGGDLHRGNFGGLRKGTRAQGADIMAGYPSSANALT